MRIVRTKYTSRLIAAFIVLTLAVFLVTSLSGNAYALTKDPIDSCFGIDHPPFENEYEGDGYSYLNVGLTLPLEHFEGGYVTGVLTGEGKTVETGGQVDADGRVYFSFPLYAYGEYTVWITDEDGLLIFEKLVTVGAQEVLCDFGQLAKSPPAETAPVTEEPTAPTEKPTAAVPEEPSAAPPDETTTSGQSEATPTADAPPAYSADDLSHNTWWLWTVIAVGLLIAAAGFLLIRHRPCDKERLAWEAAKLRYAQARKTAEQARSAEDQAAALRAGIEAELEAIRHSYPSAGKPGGDEAWVEMGGRRITSRDVALRREAENAAWERYRQNPTPETAQELENTWNEYADPLSETERREIDEQARDLERRLEDARQAENEALQKREEAEKAAEQTASAADEAQRAYEECMNKARAASSGAATGTGTGEGVGTAQGGTEGGGCREDEPPQERNRRELGIVTLPVRLQVNIRGGDAHAAAQEGKEISDQLANASEKLGWISKAMDLKSIGSALARDRSGWKALGEGVAPGIGLATGTPVPTSPGQAAVDFLSVAANIASVIVGKVPELQARRLPDCDLEISVIRRALQATCVEIWVCRGGQWVLDDKRFTLQFVREIRTGTRTYNALTWAQAQEQISRFERIEMNTLKNALDQIARMEAECGS